MCKMISSINIRTLVGRFKTVVILNFALVFIKSSSSDLFFDKTISSGGIKSQVTDCHKKKGPGGLQKEYCYINNEEYSEIAKYFKTEQAKTGKSCKKFKLSDFNKNSPSIMYGEAHGRLGNQLLEYAMLLQLGSVRLKLQIFRVFKMFLFCIMCAFNNFLY